MSARCSTVALASLGHRALSSWPQQAQHGPPALPARRAPHSASQRGKRVARAAQDRGTETQGAASRSNRWMQAQRMRRPCRGSAGIQLDPRSPEPGCWKNRWAELADHEGRIPSTGTSPETGDEGQAQTQPSRNGEIWGLAPSKGRQTSRRTPQTEPQGGKAGESKTAAANAAEGQTPAKAASDVGAESRTELGLQPFSTQKRKALGGGEEGRDTDQRKQGRQGSWNGKGHFVVAQSYLTLPETAHGRTGRTTEGQRGGRRNPARSLDPVASAPE